MCGKRLMLRKQRWRGFEGLRNSDASSSLLHYNTLMTTLLEQPVSETPTPSIYNGEQRLVLHNVTWAQYQTIGNLFTDRPGLRITFDRGMLEFMTTSPRHERYKRWLGRYVETIAEELETPVMPGGSMTFQKEDVERGFENDDCFWIAHEPNVRTKDTWDPAVDPPPDLALEIEVSRSALKRMAIFASFRIPEVWCCNGDEIRIYLLESDGTYKLSPQSLAFPTIPVHELVKFFPPVGNTDYLSTVAAVRAWVRSLLGKSA
jgi:Uma2 family endonuclease